jgi:hypothetical protein
MASATAPKTTPVGSLHITAALQRAPSFLRGFQYFNRTDDALPPATATPAEVAHCLLHLLVPTLSIEVCIPWFLSLLLDIVQQWTALRCQSRWIARHRHLLHVGEDWSARQIQIISFGKYRCSR